MATRKKRIARKKVKKRDIPRPYCDGTWTLARFRSFAMSALRRAQWAPRHTVIDRAFTRKGINLETGKPCMLHRCERCGKEFPKGQMEADHVNPVIPIGHNWNKYPNSFLGYDWNEVMRRLWIEKGDGWEVLCGQCHSIKTSKEKEERKLYNAK